MHLPKPHLITQADVASCLRPRPSSGHKGSFGHVFVIGGSLGKIGAPLMAAHSALRSGAGLSTVVLPMGAYDRVDPKALEIMYEPIKNSGDYFEEKDVREVLHRIGPSDIVALGPGLGLNPKTIAFVHRLIKNYSGPLVLDADGLNAVSKKIPLLKRDSFTLLTPHPGEMGRLLKKTTAWVQLHRLEATHFARRYRVHLVLKGHHTLVAFPDGTVWVNPTGNSKMAVAGQGDVLTGIYAGLLAQFPKSIEATLFGCFLHGLVGDILAKKGSPSVLPTDIAKHLDLGYSFLKRISNLGVRGSVS